MTLDKTSIIILVVIFAISYILKKLDNKKYDYSECYQEISVLTNYEKEQYIKIKSVTDKMNLILFSKVRLADIVEPKKGKGNWQTLFNKIRAKHVDFLVLNPDLSTLCAIEIDDRSHLREDRKKRDIFVNEILAGAEIEILREKVIDEADLRLKLYDILRK